MSKTPQIIFWSLLYSKYIAGDSPCRLSHVCEPFVSELCSLNLAPLPSSFEQHTGNHLPLSSCYVRFSSRTIFTGHLHTHIHDRQGQLQDGQGGQSQLGSSCPSLPSSPFPDYILLLLTLLDGLSSCGSLCKAELHSSVLLGLALSLVTSACLPKNWGLSETDCQRALDFVSTRILNMSNKATPLFLLGNLVFSFVLQKWENPLILKQMYANTFINIGNRKISYCFLYK